LSGEFEQRIVIELPTDLGRRAQLSAKLDEYKQRLNGRRDKYQAPELDSVWWKIRVLETLLGDEKQVDTFDLSREIVKELGQRVFTEWQELFFDNACGVIEAYATGNTADLSGGTGLPNVD
jgi:hypothetical protein